jgi:hypothetical protein
LIGKKAAAALAAVLGIIVVVALGANFYLNTPKQATAANSFHFSFATSQNDATIVQGANVTLSLEATYVSGNAQPITFSASGGPNGTSYCFTNQNGVVTNFHTFKSNLTVSTPANASSDFYPITLWASAANSSGAKSNFNLTIVNSEITVFGTLRGTTLALAGYSSEEIYPTNIAFTSNTTGKTYELHVKRYGDTEQAPGKFGNYTITLPNLDTYKVQGYFFSLPHYIPVPRVLHGETQNGYLTLNCTVGVTTLQANYWG